MILTASLRALLDHYKNTLPVEDYENFKWNVESAVDFFMKDLAHFPEGAARGRRVHSLLEQEIKKAAHIPVSCHKGCSACCHFEVEITRDDAEVLREVLISGVDIDFDRLLLNAKRERQGPEWKRGQVPENRCVFLSPEGACRVYESRPASCRKLSVTSPASECAKVDGHPVPLSIPMADAIISAALSSPHNEFSAMAKMLVKVLEQEETQSAQPPAP